MKAYYVSVWDGGTEIRTSCDYNPETNDVTNIEQCEDVGDLDVLEEEYVYVLGGEKI